MYSQFDHMTGVAWWEGIHQITWTLPSSTTWRAHLPLLWWTKDHCICRAWCVLGLAAEMHMIYILALRSKLAASYTNSSVYWRVCFRGVYPRLLLRQLYFSYGRSFFLSFLNYSFSVMMIPLGSVCVRSKLRDCLCVNYFTTCNTAPACPVSPPQTSLRQRWGSSATWPSCSSACPTRQSVPSSPPSSPSFPSLSSHSLVSPPPTPAYTPVSASLESVAVFAHSLLFFSVHTLT